jgi:hypothetical protein
MDDFETPAETTWWDHFWGEQERLTSEYFFAPSNRTLVGVSLLGGLVSALALGRLYGQLTEGTAEGALKDMAGRSLTAMAIGVVAVLWEVNKAHYQPIDTLGDEDFLASELS